MKVNQILFFLIFITFFAYSKEYKITKADNNIIIKNEQNEIIFKEIPEIINNLNSGDKLLFERGKVFNFPIVLNGKDHITIGSYGEGRKAKISLILPIPFDENQSFEIFYSKDKNFDKNDTSFKNLSKDFHKHFLLLSSKIRGEISDSFEEVKDFIDYVIRIKLPLRKFQFFDPHALRVWLNGRELLKLMLFEELKCKECKDSIRWYFEDKYNYLYLFIRGSFIDFNVLKKYLRINNSKVDVLSIRDSKNITISSLEIEGGKYALAIRGSSFVNVFDSKIGKGSFVGVEITNSLDSNLSSDYNVIDSCMIDSGFRFRNYRFHSSRGSQDGVFLVGEASYNKILNSVIKDWGHSGINLFAQNGTVSNNEFISNRVDGADIPYMHGFTIGGEKCVSNKFFSNFFMNLGARNQLGGVKNSVYRNYFANIFNSQIKKDQGYGSGQGIWLQTFAKENYITDNIFIGCDEAAISLVSFGKDGVKEKNTISRNFIINCGKNIFNKPYKNCVIEIFDKNDVNIKNNNFIKNKIFARDYEPIIYYHGEELSVDEFNLKMGSYGDFIVGNKLIK